MSSLSRRVETRDDPHSSPELVPFAAAFPRRSPVQGNYVDGRRLDADRIAARLWPDYFKPTSIDRPITITELLLNRRPRRPGRYIAQLRLSVRLRRPAPDVASLCRSDAAVPRRSAAISAVNGCCSSSSTRTRTSRCYELDVYRPGRAAATTGPGWRRPSAGCRDCSV